MNPDAPQTPRDEIEVRLTALLLGELAPAEAAAMQSLLAADPALTALHARLRHAIELLREALAIPEQPAPQAPARLSDARREKLLAHFKKTAPSTATVLVKPKRDWKTLVPLGIAALLIAFIGVLGIQSLQRYSLLAGSGVSDPRLLSESSPPLSWFRSKREESPPDFQSTDSGLAMYGRPADSRWGSQPGTIRSEAANTSMVPAPNATHWMFEKKPAEAENPVVGRTAFWSEDEAAKVNTNTASEGTFWDTAKRGQAAESQMETKLARLEKNAAANNVEFAAEAAPEAEVLRRSARFAMTPPATPAPNSVFKLYSANKMQIAETTAALKPAAGEPAAGSAPARPALAPLYLGVEAKTSVADNSSAKAGELPAGLPREMGGRMGGTARDTSSANFDRGFSKNVDDGQITISNGVAAESLAFTAPPTTAEKIELPKLAQSDLSAMASSLGKGISSLGTQSAPAVAPTTAGRPLAAFDTDANGYAVLADPQDAPASGPAPARPAPSTALGAVVLGSDFTLDSRKKSPAAEGKIAPPDRSDDFFTGAMAGDGLAAANAGGAGGGSARGRSGRMPEGKPSAGGIEGFNATAGVPIAGEGVREKSDALGTNRQFFSKDPADLGTRSFSSDGAIVSGTTEGREWFGKTPDLSATARAMDKGLRESVRLQDAESAKASVELARGEKLADFAPPQVPQSFGGRGIAGSGKTSANTFPVTPATPALFETPDGNRVPAEMPADAAGLKVEAGQSLAGVPAQQQPLPYFLGRGVEAEDAVKLKGKLAPAAMPDGEKKPTVPTKRLYESVDEFAKLNEPELKQQVKELRDVERIAGKPSEAAAPVKPEAEKAPLDGTGAAELKTKLAHDNEAELKAQLAELKQVQDVLNSQFALEKSKTASAEAQVSAYKQNYTRPGQTPANPAHKFNAQEGEKAAEPLSQSVEEIAKQVEPELKADILDEAGEPAKTGVEELMKEVSENKPAADFAEVARTNRVSAKLNRIIIPRLEFRDATIREAVEFLAKKSRDLDTLETEPVRKGVNVVLKMPPSSEAPPAEPAPSPMESSIPGLESATPPEAVASADPNNARITLSLSNVPLAEVFRYVADLANLKLKVDPYAVSIEPLGSDTAVLPRKEYKVRPGFLNRLASGESADAKKDGSSIAGRVDAKDFLIASGVTFPTGASATFLGNSGRLLVRNLPENLDRIEALIAADTHEEISKAEAESKRVELAKLEEAKKKIAAKDSEDKPAPPKPAEPAPTPQPEIATSANAFSTFSLNVTDVSFKLAAASLEKGQMPEVATVRSEEFINAFDYRDPEPAAGAALALTSERARYPFAQNRDLLRCSVKTAAAGRQPGRALNLVLLLDNSGSMERADRVRILREALRVLAAQLQPQDKLSVVTFARTPRLWADGVAGDKAGAATARVGEITPQGGTNLSVALDLGYETARRHFAAGGINRVVLLTDGAANLGDVNPDALKKKVEAQRRQGVALDCFGIGWEGYDDTLLEALSRNGDGRYGFLNSPEAAATEFAGQLAGALRVAASDVKVQIEWNPRRVTAWRQIGYAKHQLKKEQFRDNTVDAAEIGAAESGNALYAIEVNPRGAGEIATVRVRFKVPGTSDYREHEWTVPFTREAAPLEQASAALRLAGTASAFSEMLAGSPFAAEVTSDRLLALLNGVPAAFGADPRPQKLEWMIRTAKSVSGR